MQLGTARGETERSLPDTVMLETLSGRFPRFIWSDPTRPFANASVRLEKVVSERTGAPSTHRDSGLVATITAMAGHLRAWGESRDSAWAAIRQEIETAFLAKRAPAEQTWSPEMIDEVVRLAVDSCYGSAEPAPIVTPPKPAPRRRRRPPGSPRRRADAE